MVRDEIELVYKVCSAAEWRAALVAGRYEGSDIDQKDGFIHLSTARQLPETLARHFVGQRDLVLVAFAPGDLGAGLRWEPSRGGQLFPHLHGALSTAAALSVAPLDSAADPATPRT
jgi:uncharacterized protein (DUF952 family)